jgi:hypothetical protein
LDLLYLNLKKLAISADFSIALNQMSANTSKQLSQIMIGKEGEEDSSSRTGR